VAIYADVRPTILAAMASLWTEQLFLHGYLSGWRLARRLADRSAPGSPGLGAARAPADPPRVASNGGAERRVCQGIGDGAMRHQ
jgi:hypothetical protein